MRAYSRYQIAGAVTPAAVNAVHQDLDQRVDAVETTLARQNTAAMTVRVNALAQQVEDLAGLEDMSDLVTSKPVAADLAGVAERRVIYTAGGVTALDGADGPWLWDPQDHSNGPGGTGRVARDPDSTHTLPPTTSPTGVDGAYIKTGPKNVYYLKNFGSETDHRPLARAAALMQTGETLIVPGAETRYFDEPMIFTQTGLSIIGPPGPTIYCPIWRAGQADMWLLTFGCCGGLLANINFRGLLAEEADLLESCGSVDGIKLDRGGNAAAYANLDQTLTGLHGYGLRDFITTKGRNVHIVNCKANAVRKFVIIGIYTYTENQVAKKSATRGIVVQDCKVQNIGQPLIYGNDPALDTVVIESAIDDTLAVENEAGCSQLRIVGNTADRCGPFYRGTITNSVLDHNQLWMAHGTFAEIGNSADYTCGDWGRITNNQWHGRVDPAHSRAVPSHFVKATKTWTLHLNGNVGFGSAQAALYLDTVGKVHIVGDTYHMPGNDVTHGDYPGLYLKPSTASTTYRGITLQACMVYPRATIGGTNYGYTYAVEAPSNGDWVSLVGGHYEPGRSGLFSGLNRYQAPDHLGVLQTSGVQQQRLGHEIAPTVKPSDWYTNNTPLTGRVSVDIAAGEDLSTWNGVALTTNEDGSSCSWMKWSPTESDKKYGKVGIVIVAATTGNYPTVLLEGHVYLANYGVLPGRPAWLAATGGITTTRPTTQGAIRQLIGYGLPAKQGLFFQPGPPEIIP